MSKKVQVEDIYDPDKMLMGMAVLLSWTLFLPLRLLAWLANRSETAPTTTLPKQDLNK